MTKSWRPKGWKTPNALALGEIKSDVVVTSDQVRFLTQEQIETYEAGADAMLEALRDRAYARQTISGGKLIFVSHPDNESEIKSGRFVFIPDDEEGE